MTSETRTVCFNVDPALNAYLAWIAEAGREFDMGAYDLFAAGYRARTDGDAAQAEVARLRAALAGVGHPFRGGPNLCWCPSTWSGPETHTAACLVAFTTLAAAGAAGEPTDGAAEGDGRD